MGMGMQLVLVQAPSLQLQPGFKPVGQEDVDPGTRVFDGVFRDLKLVRTGHLFRPVVTYCRAGCDPVTITFTAGLRRGDFTKAGTDPRGFEMNASVRLFQENHECAEIYVCADWRDIHVEHMCFVTDFAAYIRTPPIQDPERHFTPRTSTAA